MIARIRRYFDNLGALNGLLMLTFIGIISWRTLHITNTVGMVLFGGTALVLMVLPLATMPYFLPRPMLAFRCMRVGQYAFYALIANAILNLVPIPPAAGIPIVMAMYLYVGFGFWFFSSPQIVTAQGGAKVMGRIERHEEAVLRDEIARNDRILNDPGAG